MRPLTIVLTAVDAELADAWHEHCGHIDIDDVTIEVAQGNIADLVVDAVVSPANSFGFMQGGLDAVYARHFGPGIETRVRDRIAQHHGGELVVGSADVVETGDAAIPMLVVAPTMRVPMRLVESVNPYLAARAAVRLALDHPRLKSMAIPGLGTGVGGVAANICAHQVHRAIIDASAGPLSAPMDWTEAVRRHDDLIQ